MTDHSQPPPPPAAPNTVTTPPRGPSPWRSFAQPLIIGALVLAFLVGVGGTLGVISITSAAKSVAAAALPSPLVAAVAKCNLKHNPSANLGDGGKSLAINNKGEEDDSGLSFDDELCLLHAVKVPDSTLDEMEATRALDGRQTATWGKVSASWSYHPDQGLDVILELK